MAEVLATAAAVGASGAYAGMGALWEYNRQNFAFDVQMRQNRMHQAQNMRLKQASLYREDLRDLFGLTVTKMDSYMTVNTFLLGFVVGLYQDGALPPDTVTVIFWLHALSICSSFLYLSLSLWFSVYTSLLAQSHGVQVLVRYVRLPVPSHQELQFAASYMAEFELDFATALRLPFIVGKKPAGAPEELAPLHKDLRIRRELHKPQSLLDAQHMRIFEHFQTQWKGYDSYARISLALGTWFLFQALMYHSIGYLMVDDLQPLAGCVFVSAFALLQLVLLRLELAMQRRWEWALMTALVVLCPFATLLSVSSMWVPPLRGLKDIQPLACGLNMGFFAFLLWQISHRDKDGVPTRFRSIVFLDVFTWLREKLREENALDDWSESSEGEAEDKRFKEIEKLEERVLRWAELFLKAFESEGDLGRPGGVNFTSPIELRHENQREEVLLIRADLDAAVRRRKALGPSHSSSEEESEDTEEEHSAETEDSPEIEEDGWIRMDYADDAGSRVPCWRRPFFNEVLWQRPPTVTREPPDFSEFKSAAQEYLDLIEEVLPVLEQQATPTPIGAAAGFAADASAWRRPNRLFMEASLLLLLFYVATFLWSVALPFNLLNLKTLDLTPMEPREREMCKEPEEDKSTRRLQAESPVLRLEDAGQTMAAERRDRARALLLEAVFGSPKPSAAPPATVDTVAVDESALRLLEVCPQAEKEISGEALFLHGRQLAARLRAEADLGDGRLSKAELSLWLQDPSAGLPLLEDCLTRLPSRARKRRP